MLDYRGGTVWQKWQYFVPDALIGSRGECETLRRMPSGRRGGNGSTNHGALSFRPKYHSGRINTDGHGPSVRTHNRV